MAVDTTPLSARSTVLSLLLGSHPEPMSAAQLVRAGEHFEIPPATIRVALTRAVGAGDLRRVDGNYTLGERLIHRQQRQNEAVLDTESGWDGRWEMAVVVVSGRSGTERASLRDRMASFRLAELREGVWTRPANLRRAREYVEDTVLNTFTVTPDEEPVDLAGRLWDLNAWALAGRQLLGQFHGTTAPATRLAVAARMVRHLSGDPMLPAELLPADWPAASMRSAYSAYQEELRDLSG